MVPETGVENLAFMRVAAVVGGFFVLFLLIS
jgi:hypothetical protein